MNNEIEFHNSELSKLFEENPSKSLNLKKLSEIEQILKIKNLFLFERIDFSDSVSFSAESTADISGGVSGADVSTKVKSGLFKAAATHLDTGASDDKDVEADDAKDYTGYDNVWVRTK